MSTRVLLHVGTPKTGTSYLQDVLYHNRRTLAAANILYPADRFDAHFLAALDLMRLPWGGLEAEAVGAWDRLAARVGSTPFFAYDRAAITGRVARLRAALGGRIALKYAVKANPMPAVVQHLAGLVDAFDVASSGEMQVALDTPMPMPAAPQSTRAGIDGKRK